MLLAGEEAAAPGGRAEDSGTPKPTAVSAGLRAGLRLVALLSEHDFAGAFLDPIDPVAFGLVR